MAGKKYDQAYYDRWYRDPARRVILPAAVARKVRLVLGIAEALLERPVRSVLDIGCGEAPWRAHLRALRPRLHYQGVESSEYVVERFGRRRNILHGSFGTLASLPLRSSYDLIVVCDVLHYIPEGELGPGLRAISDRLDGVTYLEAYTTADAIEGDKHDWHHRSPEQMRRHLRRAGLHPVGMHCYVGEALHAATAALERGHP